jgi:hypothetical protein
MGEPISTGMMIGAALGGGTSALRGKNPIEGALMGGLTGGIGGGISGGAMGGSSSPFSLGSILNGIGTNAAAGGDPAKGLAMNAAALAGSGGGFNPLSGGGYGSIGTAGQAAGGASGGMFSGMSMPSTITGLGKDISALNTFMNQNPVTSQIGLQTASSLMQEPQVQYAQPGQVQRGQIAPMDYMSLLNPQGQSVMRPQPISLL